MAPPPAPEHVALGAWILDVEARQTQNGDPVAAMHRACGAMYAGLAPLMTMAGSQALLTRSLQLTRVDFPFLEGLRGGPAPDTCLDGLDAALDQVSTEEARDALVAVLARMIDLLVTFIGADLAMHRVRNIWPDAPNPHDRQEGQL